MREDSEFREGGEIFSKLKPVPRQKTVVKNEEIRLGPPAKIGVSNHFKSYSAAPQLKPIRENGEVVGIINECSCGEVVKIYFDFAENEKPV